MHLQQSDAIIINVDKHLTSTCEHGEKDYLMFPLNDAFLTICIKIPGTICFDSYQCQ